MKKVDAVIEQSTRVFRIGFFDEQGTPVVPTSASWSLMDGAGQIVNERDQVEIQNLDSTIHVAVHGADLDYRESPGGHSCFFDDDGFGDPANLRMFVVDATYFSALTLTHLPVKQGIRFRIKDMPGV